MKTLVLYLLVILGSLFGCSNTVVHLHANSVPETEREKIRIGLEKRGFSVKLRDNEPPSDSNIILYYPHNGIEEDLYAIDEVLEASGLKAEHSYATHTEQLGKHEYTAGNIGLYVVGRQENTSAISRVRSAFPMTLTDYEFVSMDCEKEYVYQFFDGGTLEVSDFSLAVGEDRVATLGWRRDSDDIVVVSNGSEQFKYKKTESHIEHSSEHSDYVVTYNIRLQPIGYYHVPFGCSYKSTFFESY